MIGIGYGPDLTNESLKENARDSLRCKFWPNNDPPSDFSKLNDFILFNGRIVFLLLEAAEAEPTDDFEIALTSDVFVIGRLTSFFKSYWK